MSVYRSDHEWLQMMDPTLHEEETIELRLRRTVGAGELNRVLRGIGFKLYYDVYGMDREDRGFPVWQARTLVGVYLYLEGEEVDAQDGADAIGLRYLLASLPSSLIDDFVRIVEQVRDELGGELILNGAPVDGAEIRTYLDGCTTELMEEWGEEPGSESLAIMIHELYRSP